MPKDTIIAKYLNIERTLNINTGHFSFRRIFMLNDIKPIVNNKFLITEFNLSLLMSNFFNYHFQLLFEVFIQHINETF